MLQIKLSNQLKPKISDFCFLEIEGPEETVYAKGIFKIKIQIPERYG